MEKIKNVTPHFYGYDNYPRNEGGKILLDRADDGKIIIKRKNTMSLGDGQLLALCDGAKISEKDWQDLRRGFYLEEDDGSRKYHFCIGGSDAGAVMGVSSYSSPLNIYNAKKSMVEPEISDDLDYRFEYGHVNEPLIAKAFARKMKAAELQVFKNDCVFFNESTGFMQANVDYFVKSKHGLSILEIKTTSPNSTTDQDAKIGQVPATYYAQAVLHYPMALGSAFNIVGTYFAIGSDNNLSNIRFCHFKRDPEKESALMQSEREFVDRLVNNNPPKDTSTPTQRLEKSGLAQKESRPVAVELDDKAKAAAVEYAVLNVEEKKLKDQINQLQTRKDELKAIICEQLGDAASSTEFTVNNQKYVAKWGSSRTISINKTVLKAKYPDVYEDKDVASESISRRFTMNVKEVKK